MFISSKEISYGRFSRRRGNLKTEENFPEVSRRNEGQEFFCPGARFADSTRTSTPPSPPTLSIFAIKLSKILKSFNWESKVSRRSFASPDSSASFSKALYKNVAPNIEHNRSVRDTVKSVLEFFRVIFT